MFAKERKQPAPCDHWGRRGLKSESGISHRLPRSRERLRIGAEPSAASRKLTWWPTAL